MWKPVHRPVRSTASASEVRRLAASTRRKARSAVVSSRMPGVLQTTTPAAVAASTSMLSNPTATLATTRRRPFPAPRTAASTRSVRRQTIPSTPAATASASPAGSRGSSSGRWITSHGGPGPSAATSGSVPPAGSGRVTRTRGGPGTTSATGAAGRLVGRLGQLGDRALEASPGVVGLAVGAGGVADVDTLEDHRDLPVGEGHVVVDLRQVTPRAGGVAGGDLLAAGKSGGHGRRPRQRRHLVAGFGPVDQQHAEVGQGVSEGAQLPVEDGLHRPVGGGHDGIVEAVVAVNDPGRAGGRDVGRQPVRHLL